MPAAATPAPSIVMSTRKRRRTRVRTASSSAGARGGVWRSGGKPGGAGGRSSRTDVPLAGGAGAPTGASSCAATRLRFVAASGRTSLTPATLRLPERRHKRRNPPRGDGSWGRSTADELRRSAVDGQQGGGAEARAQDVGVDVTVLVDQGKTPHGEPKTGPASAGGRGDVPPAHVRPPGGDDAAMGNDEHLLRGAPRARDPGP